ncbi:hypothetical protein ACO0LF_15125 [Undibacterium sp. Di27W]|uniref:hypothetical protein n=1 Tax=Undibacterium sp. Di27W TaxID=3413036 RepID=UPI003BF108BA
MRIQIQRICLAMVMLGSLFCGLAQAADTDGQILTTDDKHVKFWAAGKPEKTVEKLSERKGFPYQRTTYTMEAEGSMLMLGVLEFHSDDSSPAGYEMAYLNTMLDNLRRGFISKFALDADGGWVDISLPTGNLKGKQLKGRLQGQDFTLRAYVAPHTIYMQQIGHSPIDKKAAEVANKFLQSLVIEKE